ncbi:hypothetical protein GCM10022631_29690 [Deinococcus rubellus]
MGFPFVGRTLTFCLADQAAARGEGDPLLLDGFFSGAGFLGVAIFVFHLLFARQSPSLAVAGAGDWPKLPQWGSF